MKCWLLTLIGLLGLCSAAVAQDYLPPPAITNVTVTIGKTTAAFSWTAPGDQCTNNTCAEYDLRFSTSSPTECTFTNGTRVTISSPSSPGTNECISIPVGTLHCNTTYYFAVKTKDSSGNWSAMSNVVSKTTKSCTTGDEVTCINLIRHPDGRLEVDQPLIA